MLPPTVRSPGPGRPPRKAMASLLAGVGAALLALAIGVHFFVLPHRQVASQPAAVATKELLECLVCGQPVDPDTTQYKLTYEGQRIFFDKQECLDAFVAHPTRYGHLKVDVNWSPNPGVSPSAVDPGAAAPPCPSGAATDPAQQPCPAGTVAPAPVDSGAPPADTPTADDQQPQPTDQPSGDGVTPDAPGDDQTQDPNPPPLHQPPAGGGGDVQVDTPAPPTTPQAPQPSSSGESEDVPAPPAGQ